MDLIQKIFKSNSKRIKIYSMDKSKNYFVIKENSSKNLFGEKIFITITQDSYKGKKQVKYNSNKVFIYNVLKADQQPYGEIKGNFFNRMIIFYVPQNYKII